MAASEPVANAIAWRAIGQCRREIAAAWEQVDAAIAILRRSEWLLRRWTAQAGQADMGHKRVAPRPSVAGMLVTVEPEGYRERQLRRRREKRRHVAGTARMAALGPNSAQPLQPRPTRH